MSTEKRRSRWEKLKPYVQIARIDHWLKNVFMLFGALVAALLEHNRLDGQLLVSLGIGLLATCLVASSNYVINEHLDAETDRSHPIKSIRPAAAGATSGPIVVVEWLALYGLGLGLSAFVNLPFALALTALWVMGAVYNVRPLRTKELPYLDVLSESVNNPLRLLLGWFVVLPHTVPPATLLLSYWMVGAFFMALKRFAEYRSINDPARAAMYRKSFRYYDADRLLISVMFYAAAASFFGGVFIIRYHLELVLGIPLAAGFFALYLRIGLRKDSPVQHPERLHKERGLVIYSLATLTVFVLLMFVRIPILYEALKVRSVSTPALWQF